MTQQDLVRVQLEADLCADLGMLSDVPPGPLPAVPFPCRFNKMTSVFNRSPGDGGRPTRRDALLHVWVTIATFAHRRSVSDIEATNNKAEQRARDARHATTDGDDDDDFDAASSHMFGGMPTASDGCSKARFHANVRLLQQTRHPHVKHQVDAGQVAADTATSKLLAAVAMGPPGSQWTAGALSHDDNKTTTRATHAAEFHFAGVLVQKRWVVVFDMTTLTGLGTCVAPSTSRWSAPPGTAPTDVVLPRRHCSPRTLTLPPSTPLRRAPTLPWTRVLADH